MEARLLGGMIRYPATIPGVLRFIRSDDFRSESDQLVFSTLAALSKSESVIDLVVLAESLYSTQGIEGLMRAGGYSRLAELWEEACPEDQVLPLARQYRKIEKQ